MLQKVSICSNVFYTKVKLTSLIGLFADARPVEIVVCKTMARSEAKLKKRIMR